MRGNDESLPIVGRAYRLGVNPVTTTLVLLGPVVIGIIAIASRSPVTVALGIMYVLSLPGSVAYFWVIGSETGDAADDGERDHERATDDEKTENNTEHDTGDEPA